MIEHRGKIVNIQGNMMEITIQPSSACGSCQAKGYCTSADTSERLLTIPWQKEFSIGDDVLVKVKEWQAYWAVFYAYGIPLLIVLILLFWGESMSLPEWKSALMVFAILFIYFLAFYRWGKKLTKTFEFKVEKIKP